MSERTGLGEAIRFHGHLGPWLVLGMLVGDFALKKTGAKKYFDLSVKVWGANKKPKSCFIDGLQLSTGATYGKGNIRKISASKIRILLHNLDNNKKINIFLKEELVDKLNSLKGHRDCEAFAKKLYRTNPSQLLTHNL